MKKLLSVLVALMLVLSMTAFAEGVPSKTTSDLAEITEIETETDAEVSDDFVIEVVEDTIMTAEEVENLYEAVVEEDMAPINYFDEEVQAAILESLNENVPETEALVLDDLKDWEINEFCSIDAENYDPTYGDVTAVFEFATPYEVGQKLIALLALYDGTRTEVEPNVFRFNAEWIPLDAEVIETVTEDGETTSRVAVTFPVEVMTKMEDSVASSIAILSEPFEAAEK